MLYATYLFVGVFGAQTLVGVLEDACLQRLDQSGSDRGRRRIIPLPLIRDFLVGDYGLITMGLTYAMAIVLPVVTTFFLMFGFLEDSGYIPRLAIFSDRLFRSMGLNGKAVLPMVLGLGCDTMATMTTRILGTPKERLIAITLLALGVPCSAQLATIMGILGGISVWALLLLFGVVLSQMVLVGFLAARALPGDRSDFILELPPIRLPRMRNLATKTALRVRWYLGEAVPLFLVGYRAAVRARSRRRARPADSSAARPVVTGALGLPSESAGVFVMGFLRRDYGAAGLFKMAHEGSLTGVQSVIALTVMTLFVPCVANLLMIIRERGLRTGLAILARGDRHRDWNGHGSERGADDAADHVLRRPRIMTDRPHSTGTPDPRHARTGVADYARSDRSCRSTCGARRDRRGGDQGAADVSRNRVRMRSDGDRRRARGGARNPDRSGMTDFRHRIAAGSPSCTKRANARD